MWDPAEDRTKKKLRKTGKTGAMTAGAGATLWIFTYLYPGTEEAQKVIPLLRELAPGLVVYGIVVLALLMFKGERALFATTLLTWLALPSYVAWLLMSHMGH